MATDISTPVEIGSLIYRKPTIHDGRPSIAGTGISVQNIAILHRRGLSAEEIAFEKGITLAQSHAALAYYYANQQEILATIREDVEEYNRLEADWRKSRGENHV